MFVKIAKDSTIRWKYVVVELIARGCAVYPQGDNNFLPAHGHIITVARGRWRNLFFSPAAITRHRHLRCRPSGPPQHASHLHKSNRQYFYRACYGKTERGSSSPHDHRLIYVLRAGMARNKKKKINKWMNDGSEWRH